MIMFKADKEDITLQVEGYGDEVVCEIAGILDAIKQDKKLGKLFAKAVVLLAVYEEGEKGSDKQSSSDRAIN